MFLTIVAILSILVDIAVGGAAYKLARTVERNQHNQDMTLLNHDGRIKLLEERTKSCGQS